MNIFIQLILFGIIFLAIIFFFVKPEFVLYLFIGSIPLDLLIVSDLFSLPKILGIIALISFMFTATLKKKKIFSDKTFLLIFFFVIWGGFSYFWSIDPNKTIITLTTLIQVLILYFLIINQVRNQSDLNLMMTFLFGGAIIFAGFGLFDLIMIQGQLDSSRLASIAQNANWYFVVSICLIPACYWMFIKNKRKAIKILSIIVLGVLLSTSIYTQSRGGLISLVVFFLTYLLFSKSKVSWLFLIAITGIFIYQILPASFFDRIINIGTDIRITELWPAGINALKNNWLVGYGLGTNEIIVQRYLGFHSFDHSYVSVHNALLAIAIETGIIGTSLYLFFLLIPTVRLLKIIGNEKNSNDPFKLIEFSKILFCVLVAYLASWIKGGGMEYQKMLWLLLGLEASLVYIIKNNYALTKQTVFKNIKTTFMLNNGNY